MGMQGWCLSHRRGDWQEAAGTLKLQNVGTEAAADTIRMEKGEGRREKYNGRTRTFAA